MFFILSVMSETQRISKYRVLVFSPKQTVIDIFVEMSFVLVFRVKFNLFCFQISRNIFKTDMRFPSIMSIRCFRCLSSDLCLWYLQINCRSDRYFERNGTHFTKKSPNCRMRPISRFWPQPIEEHSFFWRMTIESESHSNDILLIELIAKYWKKRCLQQTGLRTIDPHNDRQFKCISVEDSLK